MKSKNPGTSLGRTEIRHFLWAFLIILLSCGSYLGIYVLYVGEPDKIGIFGYLSLGTHLVMLSVVVALITILLRRFFLEKPLYSICKAARKVATGDYTVTLPTFRNNKENDPMELLIQDFNTMTAELASTELMKQDFISNVSHELKTPLAVIENYATMLQSDGMTEEERREYARTIAEASRRLSTLVGNILQLNRLEHQSISGEKQVFDLSEQLSRCCLGFEQVWERREIDVELDTDWDIELCSDEQLLDIVWNNLLSNALKFTPEGGQVTVVAKKTEQDAIVVVEDTGCGMDEQTMRHIFDKFYQGDTSHATQGNGLGLALVKRILNLLGGSIEVDSTPGAGTAFTVKLPLA